MIPRIIKSRMRLFQIHVQTFPGNSRDYLFVVPPVVYPELFDLRFSNLIRKSCETKWTLTNNKKSAFLSFEPNVLSEKDVEMINEWQERFSQYVLIGVNKHIGSIFSNELDFCLALDYTHKKDDPEKRTLYGETVYQLKYKGDIHSLDILSSGLVKALNELKMMFQVCDPILSIIPSHTDKCNVPRKLAKAVLRETKIPFVDCILHCKKSELKNMAFSDKKPEWDQLYSVPNCVQWMGDITNKTIFLIDDLYQSGTTLWTCAKYLKKHGAGNVIGLVCVKTFRDTDNR